MRQWVVGACLCAIATLANAADFRPWTMFHNAEFKGTKLFRDAASDAYATRRRIAVSMPMEPRMPIIRTIAAAVIRPI
jgi:hypothetical protein